MPEDYIKKLEKCFSEAAHTCEHCGNKYSTPDWLDTDLHCPKCKKPAQSVHPSDREWNQSERNHYLGRDSSHR